MIKLFFCDDTVCAVSVDPEMTDDELDVPRQYFNVDVGDHSGEECQEVQEGELSLDARAYFETCMEDGLAESDDDDGDEDESKD